MPEWAQTILSVTGAAIGAYAAIRIELRFVWRDLGKLETRIGRIENGQVMPRRRWNDAPKIRRD